MEQENVKFELPNKIEQYIASIDKIYRKSGKDKIRNVIVNSSMEIVYDSSQTEWGEQHYYFRLKFKTPDYIYEQIVGELIDVEGEIQSDIERINRITNEHISNVSIEMNLGDEEDWRESTGLLLLPKKSISKIAIERIWKPYPDGVRIFISHKTECKTEVSDLKDELSLLGFSCFVAHEDIEPTKEWAVEIENALNSMDLMIVWVSDDFHDSKWTDQEVGYAMGSSVQIIPIKTQNKDPYGLFGKFQAIIADKKSYKKDGINIIKAILKHDTTSSKMKRSIIHAFSKSGSFDISKFFIKEVLPLIDKLNNEEEQDIIKAFQSNRQINECYAKSKLVELMHNWTDHEYTISDNQLTRT